MREYKNWGKWLRATRTALKLSQEKVAVGADVSSSSIRNYENERTDWQPEKAEKIERYLINQAELKGVQISQPPARG